MTNILILKLAAVAHLGLIAAGLLMPRTVGLWRHVAVLPAFERQLFKVYYGFIGFILVSFGMLTWFLANELANGSALARGLCLIMGFFWLIRLFVSAFVFDVKPFLTNGWYRLGYQATNVVFALLPPIYLSTAWKGGTT